MVMRYTTVAKQIFVFFWLAMFLYITSSVVLNTGEVKLDTERQLQRTMKELDVLHSQNIELSAVVNMLRDIYLNNSKDPNTVQQQNSQSKGHKMVAARRIVRADKKSSQVVEKESMERNVHIRGTGPSLEQELARRKVDTDVAEFWYYMRSELNKLRIKAKNNTRIIVSDIDVLLKKGAHYQKTLKNDLRTLSEGVDLLGEWRFSESQVLGSLVQRRLKFLQNPKSCNTTRKVLCQMKSCGFGCQLHHLAYCLIMAYATERTLVLESKGWKYASKGWETIFLPLSETCTSATSGSKMHWGSKNVVEEADVLELPIIDSMYNKPGFLPLAVPEDIGYRLTRFHGNPAAWWIGQIVKYLTRPQPHFKLYLEEAKSSLNFSHPIVGLQVRRTDKITTHEASFHSVEEYMTYVDEWYDIYEQKYPGVKRKVFLATDDLKVYKEAKENYPNYTFLNNEDITRSASLLSRYSETSVRGVVTDIYILSLCDYLVCTFSSQVCRAAYELMQTIRGDASGWFKSLDDIYYYGGQHAHGVIAIEPHTWTSSGEIELRVGDIIHILGNHWDGYSKGLNIRTGHTGLFPSYKVKENVVKAKMPTYPQVSLEE